MDPPEGEDIDKAILKLKLIGALLPTVNGEFVEDDGDITVLGEIVAKLPIDVLLGKLVVLGKSPVIIYYCCSFLLLIFLKKLNFILLSWRNEVY